MEIIIIALVLIIGTLIIYYLSNLDNKTIHKRDIKKPKDDYLYNNTTIKNYPYKPKNKVLSDSELRFYTVLKYSIADTNYIILPKVRLSDILVVYENKNYERYESYISSKSVDFLICDKDTFKPKLCIILDDSNIDLDNKIFKKDILTLIFNAAYLKLVRFKKYTPYKVSEIKEILNIKELSSYI